MQEIGLNVTNAEENGHMGYYYSDVDEDEDEEGGMNTRHRGNDDKRSDISLASDSDITINSITHLHDDDKKGLEIIQNEVKTSSIRLKMKEDKVKDEIFSHLREKYHKRDTSEKNSVGVSESVHSNNNNKRNSHTRENKIYDHDAVNAKYLKSIPNPSNVSRSVKRNDGLNNYSKYETNLNSKPGISMRSHVRLRFDSSDSEDGNESDES